MTNIFFQANIYFRIDFKLINHVFLPKVFLFLVYYMYDVRNVPRFHLKCDFFWNEQKYWDMNEWMNAMSANFGKKTQGSVQCSSNWS